MKKWKLTVRGTGIMGNSPTHIDEIFEIDESTFQNLQNPKSKKVVLEKLLSNRIPGISIDVNKLQIIIEEKSKPLINKDLETAIIGGAIGGKIAGLKNKIKNDIADDNDDDKSIPFDESLKEILKYKWDGDLKDTINKLKRISLLTTGYEWEFNPDSIGKENNRILSQCLLQYNSGYKYYSELISLKEIKKGKRKLFYKKIKKLYGIYILLGLTLLFILILSLIK